MMPYRQVHLDFHTSEFIPEIGGKFKKEQFQNALKLGHVNSVTIFAKCHHGWSYYPTKVNAMHPNLKIDLLSAELEACREIGIHSPVYISAGFDERMAREHPEWLIRNIDESLSETKTFSTPGYHRMCYNTPYLDKLLAEIKEVMENYHPNGIFLDISAVTPCTCAYCRKSIVSRGKSYLDNEAVMEQAEISYAQYADKTEKLIHSYNPECKIFHNAGHITRGRRDLAYANTHLELESLPTGGWGYDHFPMSAAYVRNLGMDYLGMTGKFHTTWGEFGGFKDANALRYESALSLAFGAKISIGDQMHPNGRMNEKTYALIGKAYEEVEAKEPWCYEAENICDVAVLSEEAVNYTVSTRETVFHGDIGANRVLLEGKYLYSFIDLEVDFEQFKVLILPDTIRVNESLKKRLEKYLESGGKVLLSGQSGLALEKDEFTLPVGAKYAGLSESRPNYCVFPEEGEAEVIYEQGYQLKDVEWNVSIKSQNSYFNRSVEHFSSHQHTPNDETNEYPAEIRSENMVYIAWDIFSEYGKIGSLQAKRIIVEALDYLLGDEKTVKVSLPDRGVVTLTKQEKENRYNAHLLFAHTTIRGSFELSSGTQTIEAIEDIVPLYNVKVSVNVPENVKKVMLVPQMTELPFVVTEQNRVEVTVPYMECSQVVTFEY